MSCTVSFGTIPPVQPRDDDPRHKDDRSFKWEEDMSYNLSGLPLIDTTHSDEFLARAQHIVDTAVPEWDGHSPLGDRLLFFRKIQVVTNKDVLRELETACRELRKKIGDEPWIARTMNLSSHRYFRNKDGQVRQLGPEETPTRTLGFRGKQTDTLRMGPDFKSTEWILRNALQFMSKPYCVLDRALDVGRDRLDLEEEGEEFLTPAEREIANVKNWVYFDDAAFTGEQIAKKLQTNTRKQHYYVMPLFTTTIALRYLKSNMHYLGMETVSDDAVWITYKSKSKSKQEETFLHIYKGQHIRDIADTGEAMGVDHTKLFRSEVYDHPWVYPGLTIFEHKLPDSTSFPSHFSKEFQTLYNAPVYKNDAKFEDGTATSDFLPCAQYVPPPRVKRKW
jgi:hypothetical protein